MNKIFRQTPLYKFLYLCEQTSLEKKVLDCGAGGSEPPLVIFSSFGYEVHGIEIDDTQLSLANEAQRNLNIVKGSMISLPFDDASFSFVYSYNSMFHMTKKEMAVAFNEICRVLRPKGLCFINVLSTDDSEFGHGSAIGYGEFEQSERGKTVVHSYFDAEEADELVSSLKLVLKESRIVTRSKSQQGYIDYILEK